MIKYQTAADLHADVAVPDWDRSDEVLANILTSGLDVERALVQVMAAGWKPAFTTRTAHALPSTPEEQEAYAADCCSECEEEPPHHLCLWTDGSVTVETSPCALSPDELFLSVTMAELPGVLGLLYLQVEE